MEFKLALLAVKDVEVSKKFYADLFDQSVALDLGWFVTFSGGFAVQQNFAWLTDIPKESVVEKSNNMELYFEVDDFEAFVEKLKNYPGIEYVHPPKKHEWQQRVVRIYDPDHHIIEIGESMALIAKRYLSEGFSAEETAKIIQHPVEFVQAVQSGRLG
jgi:catechol 2,3-dioxygenase-like lactoylglutathione lyase family enzyme